MTLTLKRQAGGEFWQWREVLLSNYFPEFAVLTAYTFILKIITCPPPKSWNLQLLTIESLRHVVFCSKTAFVENGVSFQWICWFRRKQHFLQTALHFQKAQVRGRSCKFQKRADISCRMIVSAMNSFSFCQQKMCLTSTTTSSCQEDGPNVAYIAQPLKWDCTSLQERMSTR